MSDTSDMVDTRKDTYVYVVTGEYDFSRNGEVCWVVGIARTEEGARRLAEADAAFCADYDVVHIDSDRYDPKRKTYDPPPPEEEGDEDEEDEDDWEDEEWSVHYYWSKWILPESEEVAE